MYIVLYIQNIQRQKLPKRQILDETIRLTVQLIFTPSLFVSHKYERNIFSFI